MRPLRGRLARAAASIAFTALLVMAVTPYPAVGIVAAAPASLDASFRDLPLSARSGDALTLQVNAPSGAACDGAVTYRDGVVQKLDTQNVAASRCRWDVTVPTDARRGTADITVNVTKGTDQATLQGSVEITRRGDDVSAMFHELPGIVRRGDGVTLRVDVDNGASCQGTIVYDDGRPQVLASLAELKERCRWTFNVPADAAYGIARMVIGVTQGTSQTTIAGSFEVGRQADDARLAVGLKDLPATVRRDDSFVVRALVPSGAGCTGSVAYFGPAPQALADQQESDGECRWSTRVPSDARPGVAEIHVVAKQGSDQQTVLAQIGVDRASSNVDAAFTDLADSITRGKTLEIRVRVPDAATCTGTITYQDDDPRPLGAQTEHKNRCLWEIDVPSNAARGTAVVRATVTDGGNATTLAGNVEVLGKGEVSKASWANDLPGSVKPGDSFDVRVSVPANSTCSGTIAYADAASGSLESRDENGAQCRWRVSVPASAAAGRATVDVSIMKDGHETKLSGSFDVAAS